MPELNRIKGKVIAVLSGKGGTGKTLLSVNLACAAGEAVYIDCDVEEPNGHLFFKPDILGEADIKASTPVLNEDLCVGCRTCVNFCKFNTLAFIKNKPYVFEDICHSCGGCILLCPKQALSEKSRVMGRIVYGKAGETHVYTGMMNIGEASGVSIIRRLLKYKGDYKEQTVFIDCPPGSACTVIESISSADYCLIAAEPTIFGAHNLEMVYELTRVLNKSVGVVLNKCTDGSNPSEEFCAKNNIPVLAHIPYDSELGVISSEGKIAFYENPKYQNLFNSLLNKINKEIEAV